MENLDKASLRRFDMKLEFKTLRIPQAQELLARHCGELKIECDRKNIEKHFHLQHLPPGDFAAVVRQHRFNPIESLEEFVRRLEEEVRVKGVEEEERKMGFV
jgi:hypothetical protein